MNSPALLLIMTGSLLGLTFPLGKLASEASITPVVWAWLIAAGSATVLLIVHLLSGNKLTLNKRYLKYYALLAVCSLVVPNVLIFTVIPELGAGFTGILFTLSPIFTLALSSLWRVKVPNWLGVIGIVVGLIGATIVTLTRGEAGQPAGLIWILAGLCIPVSLAVGNIYRTTGWPKGASAFELAIGINITAAIQLFIVILVTSDASAILDILLIKKLAIAQVIGSSAMFSIFFRLQQVGGPSYLSQIGYIAAGVALLAGTLFLDERYSMITWIGAGVIVLGIGFSIVAQRSQIK